MAKVELDISEYELMKENARLLEKSLKREQKLSDKLDKANKEKIDALKSNEKMVTIVNKQHVTTTVERRSHPDDIRRHLRHKMSKVVMYIVQEMKNNPRPFRNRDFDMMDSRFHGIDYGHRNLEMQLQRDMNPILEHVMRQLDFNPEDLHAMFFGRDNTSTKDEPEIITRLGLDQVAHDMKAEALDELKKSAREALALNPVLEKESKDSKRLYKDLVKEVKGYKEVNVAKGKEIEKLESQLVDQQGLMADNATKLTGINLVVSQEITNFGNKKKLIEIKQILNKKNERK